MANPIFSKAGTTDVTFSEAFDLPSSSRKAPRQNSQRSYDGIFKVTTKSVADLTFNLSKNEMTEVDRDALEAFLESDVVNYAERPFTYTDYTGTSHQVRYLDSNIPGDPVGPGTFRIRITLIVDRGPLD